MGSAIDANPFILVEFYAPWCGHCKSLAPEYAKAAATLAEDSSAVKLAKVDATIHQKLGEKFEIRGFPTLKFFKNGLPQEYSGGRTADTIVSWVEKKSGPAAKDLSSKEEANAFLEANKVVVIGFFKDLEAEEAIAFSTAADLNDKVKFGITAQEEVFELFDVKDKTAAVVLLKKFDEGKNVLEGEVTAESIAAFVTIDTDVKDNSRVTEFFGIEDTEIPTFRLTATTPNDMLKYMPENKDLTEENLRAFITKFQSGELKPHLKSQALPEDWDAQPVKVLVGSNFAEVALDASKDVLVEFYAPWCGHCKQLAPIWDKLGEHFEDNDKVVIAKMDMTVNELETVQVSGFPTIKLSTAGGNKEVDYDGGRTLEEFVKFLTPDPEEKPTADAKDEL